MTAHTAHSISVKKEEYALFRKVLYFAGVQLVNSASIIDPGIVCNDV